MNHNSASSGARCSCFFFGRFHKYVVLIITASQHYIITALQHYSITALQHCSITASHHHIIRASHHHIITAGAVV
jgi:hypothetical protein